MTFLIVNVLGHLVRFYPDGRLAKAVMLMAVGAAITAAMVWFNLKRERVADLPGRARRPSATLPPGSTARGSRAAAPARSVRRQHATALAPDVPPGAPEDSAPVSLGGMFTLFVAG